MKSEGFITWGGARARQSQPVARSPSQAPHAPRGNSFPLHTEKLCRECVWTFKKDPVPIHPMKDYVHGWQVFRLWFSVRQCSRSSLSPLTLTRWVYYATPLGTLTESCERIFVEISARGANGRLIRIHVNKCTYGWPFYLCICLFDIDPVFSVALLNRFVSDRKVIDVLPLTYVKSYNKHKIYV